MIYLQTVHSFFFIFVIIAWLVLEKESKHQWQDFKNLFRSRSLSGSIFHQYVIQKRMSFPCGPSRISGCPLGVERRVRWIWRETHSDREMSEKHLLALQTLPLYAGLCRIERMQSRISVQFPLRVPTRLLL